MRLFEKIFERGGSGEPYSLGRDAEIRGHLADERTLLSWARIADSIWNSKGYANNAWHEVPVTMR